MDNLRKYAFIFIFIVLANWQLVLINGLQCHNCFRWGEVGHQNYTDCINVTCDNLEDDRKAWSTFDHLKEFDPFVADVSHGKFVSVKSLVNMTDKLGVDGKNDTNCVKFLGRGSVTAGVNSSHSVTILNSHIVGASCVPAHPLLSAHFLRELKIKSELVDIQVAIKSVDVCDQKSEDKCRVTKDEFNRSGPRLGSTNVMLVICSVLAASFQAMTLI
jgi:hypothetical protein